MKSTTLILSIIISIIFAVSFVSASPNFECSFTCTDGSKSILPFISSEENCKLAVYYSECPKRNTPEGYYCHEWCYPAINAHQAQIRLNPSHSLTFQNHAN
ncbi:hypothetical protein CYY_005983 [Polysphondylium violaceum]|uniref:Secreted protein n=1 Tax=Polysphondylium violaceum TaxID=133409 RepID=A0A8J4UZ97_9MYCE|nr:hypothetical protein CYY_005983 [Polysphondylium violaceum]